MKPISYQIIADKPPRWFVELIENLPVGVFRTTLEGELVFCNRFYARIFGFKGVSHAIGSSEVDLYQEKRNRGEFIRAISESGYVEELCVPYRSLDGHPIWCSMTARAVFDDDGIVVFIDGIVRDITKRVEGREESYKKGDLLEILNGFMLILSLEGVLIDINQEGADFFGSAREQVLGREIWEFVGKEDKGVLPLLLAGINEIGKDEVRVGLVDGEGEEHPVIFHISLVRKDELPDHIVAVVRFLGKNEDENGDVTAKSKLQGVLEMAGGVAHRINQPLMIINTLLDELLLEEKPGDPQYEKIVKIHNQIEKLNEISRKIRGVKKYESMDYVGGIKIVDIDKTS